MVLEVRGVTVDYGAVRAVDGLTLTVDAGELVGLIGPNGAGKTTCIDAACGFVPYAGSVVLAGRPIDGLPAHERARAGLVRSFQGVELFDDLDVRGNLAVAADTGRWWRSRPAAAAASIAWATEVLGIGHLLDRATTELSEGERKLVGLGRCLAHRPRALLLDEPAAGLDTDESVALGARLRDVVASGVSVLLVDHDMSLVLGVCDRVNVVEKGRLIASGSPDAVRADPHVRDAYLGTVTT